MNRRLRRLTSLLAGLVLAAGAAAAQAQGAYPEHPIRMLVGQSPGSATDIVARMVAVKMGQVLGQSVVVENRAGAGGVVAAGAIAKAPPDGYFIIMSTASQTSLAPKLLVGLPYDPFKDLTYIAPVVDTAMLLVANPDSGIKTLDDLVRKAKANPGKLNFGSSGLGSASQLSMEMLAQVEGIQLAHVPYKGTAPAITSLVAGETPLLVNALGQLLPLIKGGQAVPILLFMDQRSRKIPDTPSLKDAGLTIPRVPAWIGLIGPPNLPQPIVDKLANAVHAAQQDPEIRQRLDDLGQPLFEGSGKDFEQRAEEDSQVWGKLIQDRGIKPE
jgi:tripartite-type tricarboxylate transporter receptor subunit TctC